ncbi:MAG: hypothetical protein RR201_01555 [Malacoplasma sp.]
MKNWKNFEDDVASFFDEMLKDYSIAINKLGASDSTMSDVEIILKNNDKKFYIETKMPSSQTSQFVVDIENDKFIYGAKNKFVSNEFSYRIIIFLNENYNLYKNVGQTGMFVPIPDDLAFGFIISNMKNKNVEFIISIDSNNNKQIVSVEKFSDIFNVRTILRRKKSGSSSIPKKYYNDFQNSISKLYSNFEIINKDSKMFVKFNSKLRNSDCYIESDLLIDKKYFLSYKDNDMYEVRLTSATNNPNIIFELSLKNDLDEDLFTIQSIIDYIEKLEQD